MWPRDACLLAAVQVGSWRRAAKLDRDQQSYLLHLGTSPTSLKIAFELNDQAYLVRSLVHEVFTFTRGYITVPDLTGGLALPISLLTHYQ